MTIETLGVAIAKYVFQIDAPDVYGPRKTLYAKLTGLIAA
jgi:hypothetical protein